MRYCFANVRAQMRHKSRATPIHCAPSQGTEDRIIFREVAIKMPLSVALPSRLSQAGGIPYTWPSTQPHLGGGLD
jgi:hypothetical protein